MKEIKPILAKVGVVHVRDNETPTRLTYFLRVPDNGTKQIRIRWARFIEALLRLEKQDERELWTVDIGTTYYLQGDTPKYLWRMVLNLHNTDKARRLLLSRLHEASIASAGKVTVTEYPLVGRVEYQGVTKGAYGIGGDGSSQGHIKAATLMKDAS